MSKSIKVVILGEYNSGKTSVINAILKRNFIPLTLSNTRRSAINVFRDRDDSITLFDRDKNALSFDSFDNVPANATAVVYNLGIDAPHLGRIEILEVQTVQNGKISHKTMEILQTSDVIIWCTIAMHPFKLSEKHIVSQIPRELRKQLILVVTRVDRVKGEYQLRHIEKQISTLTEPYVQDTVFMRASPTTISTSQHSIAEWEVSGGAQLLDLILEYSGVSKQEYEESTNTHTMITPFVSLRSDGLKTKPSIKEQSDSVVQKAENVRSIRELDVETLHNIRMISNNLSGLMSAGLIHTYQTDQFYCLHGDPERTKVIGLEIASVANVMRNEYAVFNQKTDIVTDVVSLKDCFFVSAFLVQTSELIFFQCDRKHVNQTIAKRALEKVVRLIEDAQK